MYGTGYIFSKGFFTGWVAIGILWLFCSSFCVALYPLWEGECSPDMLRSFSCLC
jgi:urea-proton symporter